MQREPVPARVVRPTTRSLLRRSPAAVIALLAGLGVAGLLGVASARSFTLEVAKNAKVMPQGGSVKHENIATNSKGLAVYWLSGDTQSHPECTKASGCFTFWPPVKVSSASGLSKAPGINGKLGTWRHDGFIQLTLGGHPLYTFAGDRHHTDQASGEGIRSFGGTWHVVKASASGSGGGGQTGSSTATTSPTTTSPGGCLYPPCPY